MSEDENNLELPFGITAPDLPEVGVRYSLYSSKSGAGVEEIYLRGDGRITLRRTPSRDAEPEIRSGLLPGDVFLRMLEIADDQRFESR